jgi:hypothetical protein
LTRVQAASPELFQLETIGTSVEGRPLFHLWFGRGPTKVLLWSQMHGDEPTATSALLDLIELVQRHRAAPEVDRLLGALTIHVVPMLNPDGAERYQRRNAQSIDINRDAVLLQTPEGRALKALRDRVEPRFGFNLHNQSWRTSVGRPPQPAAISLLAVAYDDARSENQDRRLAKRLCAIIRNALEPLAAGRIGRYDDEFEERAFGENLTRSGTSVVLIETGPASADDPEWPLVRLNFVALASALDALATGRVLEADPDRYDSLPTNGDRLMHTILRNATIVAGTGVAPFVGDVGIVAQRIVSNLGGERRVGLSARIDDVGDLRVYGALETIDCTGLTITPAFAAGARAGDIVRLPDFAATPATSAIAVGQPAHLFVLRPAATPGAYVVERVLRVGDVAPPR